MKKTPRIPKSGAGQYFTPRDLIKAIVDVINPKPGETICDPACGTGGFILSAHDFIFDNNKNMSAAQKRKLKEETFRGWELVHNTARLCAMNLMLHGIGSEKDVPLMVTDALASDPNKRFDIVMTNPPFGKKSSTTIVGEDGKASKEKETYERDGFFTTSNKQLNFVQHVKSILAINGEGCRRGAGQRIV